MSKKRMPSWFVALSALLGGLVTYKVATLDRDMPIGPAVDAPRDEFYGKHSTLLSYYADERGDGRPLVLLHSINAAANAYEVRPLFQHFQSKRPVYALDLPGFGFSERTNRKYSTDLYVTAITDFLEQIVGEPADVLALSLTSEFLAHASKQSPDLFNSITLISPTGLAPQREQGSSQNTQDHNSDNGFYKFLTNPIWSQGLYDLLVTKPSLRYFLKMNFYGQLDDGLLDYHYRSTHQANARFAPLTFVSGSLFTRSIMETTYKHLQIPVLVLYDEDPNVNFDLLPEVLQANQNWRARRILNTRGLPHFERLDMTLKALNNFWADIS